MRTHWLVTQILWRYIVVLVSVCSTYSLTALSDDSEFSDNNWSAGFPRHTGDSTKQLCSSAKQPQEDATVLLQGRKIHVERISEHDPEEQSQPGELLALNKFTALLALSQRGSAAAHLVTRLRSMQHSMLSFLSSEAVAGKVSRPVSLSTWLIASLVIFLGILTCGVFVPAILEFNSDEKNIVRSAEDKQPRRASRDAGSSVFMPSPQQTRHSGSIGSLMQPVVRTSSLEHPAVGRSPLPTSETFQPALSPLQTMASILGTGQTPQLLQRELHLPPPLAPSLVLPVCEARFAVPMIELAQLTGQGELGIVGLSGNLLLRVAVRNVGKRRAIEISMPEASTAPRATIGPSLNDINKPDDGFMEIRGLKGAFYGTLEVRTHGASYVTKDGEVIMTIDGDTETLCLTIETGQGLPLASVRCDGEFGETDHLAIRVEPGVDTVLVLACVFAVLLLSPPM